MNIAIRRRLGWLSVLVVGLLLVGSPNALRAEPAQGEQPEAAPAASGQLKTVAVVAGARYEKLISDISFLGSMVGKPDAGQMIEGGIALFTQGKGVNAIDKTKPWGVIVQTDGTQFFPVGCLPVAKLDDVLEIAKGFGADVKDGENGAKELMMPNKKSLFLKSQNDMVFLSAAPGSLSRLPANPQEKLTTMLDKYDLSAVVSLKNVPEMFRQLAINAMQAGMQKGMQRTEKETDEEYAARQKLAEGQMAQMNRMINEIDSVNFGWAVDSEKKLTFLDFAYTFMPGSKMAKQVAAYSEARTNFAGFFHPDAAATVLFATKADPELMAEDLAQFEQMMHHSREQLNKEIDKNEKIGDQEIRDALKAASADMFDAFEATIKEGQIDGGASLHLSADSMTMIAGVHVKEPAKLEAGLKKLESAAKKSPDFPGIKWNAANHAGVNFHTITVPVPEKDKGPRKLLGEQVEVAVGIGPESAYLAVGRDNIEAVKKAIDASAAEKSKPVAPFEFVLALGPIMDVAAAQAEDGSARESAKAVADMLKNQAQGRDHLRAVGQVVPNGLRYHLEAEEGVLRTIGVAAAEAQRKKLQANQQ